MCMYKPLVPSTRFTQSQCTIEFHLVPVLTLNWECTGVWRFEAPTFHMQGMNNVPYALAPMISIKGNVQLIISQFGSFPFIPLA